MAVMIRPTLLLRMDLDEGQFSDERVAEIRRSYSHIAPSTVTSHATNPESPENTIRFLIRLRQPYWRSSEEGADELWETSLLKWLKNMFYKVSNTLVAFNRSARERGTALLNFSWLELEFKDSLLAIRLEANSAIPSAALSLVDRARTLSNDDPLVETAPSCIRIPSRASSTTQAESVDEQTDDGGNVDGAQTDGLGEADGAVSEATNLTDIEKADETEDTAVTETTETVATPAEPTSFKIDFTIWEIEYEDGTVREFDSEAVIFRD